MQKFHNRFPDMLNPQITMQNKESVWPSAVGAFLGAFFAFAFGLVTFYLQKKLKRYWRHKRAVVELEHLVNDHLDNSSVNQYLLEGTVRTLQKHHMAYTLLNQFRLPKNINLRVGNLDVANAYLEYKNSVLKLNHGMSTWQGLNEKLQQNVIANPKLPPPIIHENMRHIQKQGESLLKFLTGLDRDAKRFLAFIRIYLRKDKHIWSIWFLNKKNKGKPIITKKETEKDLRALDNEIREISKISRKRIAEIMEN
ncbi:MAG: hypothetical protein JW991_00550 [Candidatus Pacebacteria bacterium]|nr:hypothetical protein [Candidatus Paceibacterota bacterium]